MDGIKDSYGKARSTVRCLRPIFPRCAAQWPADSGTECEREKQNQP